MNCRKEDENIQATKVTTGTNLARPIIFFKFSFSSYGLALNFYIQG